MLEILRVGPFDPEVIAFAIFLTISMLITLYAILMIHQKLRVIESEIMSLRKDESVISQEMEILAQMKGKPKLKSEG